MPGAGDFNVDEVIAILLKDKFNKPETRYQFLGTVLQDICIRSTAILINQSPLLYLDPPMNICGDIRGQFTDLIRLFDLSGHPSESNYLFLGDYVDRGKHSLETIALLLAYKIKYPDNFFLLRGNHECASVDQLYGFFDECKRRYSIKLWKTFTDVFHCLPFAAIVGDKIFCCHGGLSPDLGSMEEIRGIKLPTCVPDEGVLCDLLWSWPDTDREVSVNEARGVSHTFDAQVVEEFLKKYNFDLICRAHQVVKNGYEFFAKRKLVTLFSAPDFSGGRLGNDGAVMRVDSELFCKFYILNPHLLRVRS